MGMMSLLNFIAGAVFASVYSKIVDLGSGPLNVIVAPLSGEASVYSSIYFVLACLYIAMVSIYFTLMRKTSQAGKLHADA